MQARTAASDSDLVARLVEVTPPEPRRLWIRRRPVPWPAPAGWWLDLAAGALRHGGSGGDRLPAPPAAPGDELVWLPPVPEELEDDRQALAAELAGRGAPLLVQVAVEAKAPRSLTGGRGAASSAAPDPGAAASPIPADPVPARVAASGEPPRQAAGGAAAVWTALDLSSWLLPGLVTAAGATLDRTLGAIAGAGAPGGPRSMERTVALWPLVPGLTDRPERWEELLPRLARKGIAAVRAVRPEIAAAERRRLAEGADEAVFAALFHSAAEAEAGDATGGGPAGGAGRGRSRRAFARAAAAAGLSPFFDRPESGATPRRRLARRVAGRLIEIGDLALALGRPEARAQRFYRAARWIEREALDLEGLVREGNLGVLPWLDGEARRAVAEAVDGVPGLLGEVRREWLSAPAGGEAAP